MSLIFFSPPITPTFTPGSSEILVFVLLQRAAAPPLGGAVLLPVLGQLLHLCLQTLDLVSKVLLEEPVGLQGRVSLSLRLLASAIESRGDGEGV